MTTDRISLVIVLQLVHVCQHVFTTASCTFGGHANPVEVAGQFLGHVSLPPSRQTHHHDNRGGVGQVWAPTSYKKRITRESQGLSFENSKSLL